MKRVRLTICLAVVCVMAAVNFASAEIIRGINMDFVNVGYAGNPADTQIITEDGTSGYGAVNYNYRIGRYEIANAQWNAFITAAGAPIGSGGPAWTGAQQPANCVNWFEVAQFCNYLTSGDKSKGAYVFSGNKDNPGSFLGIDRATAISTYGTAYVIPTENEWYKAAYFKPDGTGYSLYSNGTDTAPIAGVNANYSWSIGSPWNVGTGTMEQNGTFDMTGNVWEWTENQLPDSCRGLHDGAYFSSAYYSYYGTIGSSYRITYDSSWDCDFIGFRVASVVPEPATLLLLGLGGLVLRKRRS